MPLCLQRGLYQASIQVKMSMRASAKDFQLRLSMSSHSRLAKKLSAMALSYASPTLPIDGRTPISLQRLPKSRLVYCPGSTGRRNTSMGSVGDAYDNAMAESFFASLECELIDRRSWKTFAEARMAIFTWIEGWYNPRRRHRGIGQKSPINFGKELQDKANATMPSAAKLTSAGEVKI